MHRLAKQNTRKEYNFFIDFIDLNFTAEQEVEFNRILEVSKKEYPKFFIDPINEYRIKVIIANNVIMGDEAFGKEFCNDNKEQVIIEE